MSLFKRPFLVDEELGKKDDDHRPSERRAWRIAHWRGPRPRRFLLAIIGLYALYFFFKHMPTDLGPAEERYNPILAQARQRDRALGIISSGPAPAIPLKGAPAVEPPKPENVADHEDDGDDGEDDPSPRTSGNLLKLVDSLLRVPKPISRHEVRSTVVFAASNLKSVADLIPLACSMGRQRVNLVHFVLMGQGEVSMERIQQVNGVDADSCPISWHDGRLEASQVSTDLRMERAIVTVLSYVHMYLRPQAIITQSESMEDGVFLPGLEKRMKELGVSHIALPRAANDLMWISALDGQALQAWNDVTIEILIHAPSESSGSLIRLLRSLQKADYLGSTPSVTIELPLDTDPHLLQYLQNMKWPSGKVTLRRRIEPHDMTSTESSIRSVEAFYPRDPGMSHVLVLSPQAELAPSFYHYLKYSVLHYKYSNRGKHISERLLGLSLELPSFRPTDGESFVSPPAEQPTAVHGKETVLPLFVWQMPNSNAALYFGDKWAEFHTFLSNRLTAREDHPETINDKKVISRKYPAFLEHLLELTRAQGYFMLYPSFSSLDTLSLATIHNELWHGSAAENLQHLGSIEKLPSQATTITSLLDQFSLRLPEILALPLLSYTGDRITGDVYREETAHYANKFRTRYGGCHEDTHETFIQTAGLSALFCLESS
ncbi:hypothetical protein ASPZODRAFT_287541 [Penicilliopsis zonata CBS 506.65]|uniref:Glycosyltransferase 2 n=1 Tax=Penicilliopsis zonata CBS 506.65 TaxID=1073090 RepID=A0A1L9SUM6_9EURO|nr:hypothetical protein ASPZODRAFT_287541 [Penicilliopsis zonata CBS 506.65]OJJ50920.1 hypothetical protein ASPZODRAFT_287541 [Penicilliopsis zonata CBS 506.65]